MTGQDCKLERKRRGLTLAAVAAQMGVTKARVHQIEQMAQLTLEGTQRVLTAIHDAEQARHERLAGVSQ